MNIIKKALKHTGLFLLATLGIGYSWKQVTAYRLAIAIPVVIAVIIFK